MYLMLHGGPETSNFIKNKLHRRFFFRTRFIKNIFARLFLWLWSFIPAGIYLLKVNTRNTRTRCEICLKLTIKIPKRRQCRRSGNFILNFEHVIAGWDVSKSTYSKPFLNTKYLCLSQKYLVTYAMKIWNIQYFFVYSQFY